MKTLSELLEATASGYVVGAKVRCIEDGHKYKGQIGTIVRVSTKKSLAGLSLVKMEDGKMMTLEDGVESELVK